MSDIASINQGLTQIKDFTDSVQGSEQGNSFAETIDEAIEQVDDALKESDQKVQAVNTGKSESLHEAMIAMEKADISHRFMVKMRNKAVDAYKEIMRMQV